jgi:cytochrome c oxidase cbb3-type subunit 4
MRRQTYGDAMTYETASRLAQQGGAVYFFVIFLGACAYALWPRKREEFNRAARIPLDEDM